MLLIWGKVVLKKEPIHNPTRLVYHKDKKGFINCICNEDFNLFFIIWFKIGFSGRKKKKKQTKYRKERSYNIQVLFY